VRDRGWAAVLLLGVVAVVLLLAGVLGAVGAYLRARVEAVAAADAAALAAAPVTFLPFGANGTPAEEAERFAAANGARLLWCACPVDPSWEPRTVTVQVAREIRLWPAGSLTVTAMGRAEFLPALLLTGE
jgi:secretion/DNA translocation related TadE-like protein